MHSSAPAASTQSALRSFRGRCLLSLVDCETEIARELRLPLHRGIQMCRSTAATKKPPDDCTRHYLPFQPVPGAVAR